MTAPNSSPFFPPALKSTIEYFSELTETQFYGTVSVRFDRGRIVLLNVQQAIKPENLPHS
jgi:hypothetical protein